jgi:hypothetical protein
MAFLTFALAESAHKVAATYSGGMLRKLDLAMTLVGKPKIIFLGFRSRETELCEAFAASEGGRSPQIQSTRVGFGTT